MKRSYAFLIWLLGTMLAIAVIGENLYLGVALAFAAGFVFGVVNWLAYRNRKGTDKV